MFALYEWFILPMTITRWPSRSFFLFSFCFIFFSMHVCKKTIHPSLSMRKAFFSVHLRSYTRKKNFFLYIHTHWKTLSLYMDMVYIKPLFLFKDLFFLFQYTRCLYKKFLYIHSLLIYKNFFSHIVYIQKLFSHIVYIQKNLFTHCLYTQNSFLFFIYRYNILFTMPLSFSILGVITMFVRFILGWHS